jgi:hypothetical protein
MISWTPTNQGKFRRVLLKFYTSNQQLRQFVRDNFNYSLDDLPDISTAQSVWTEALLEQAAAVGWIGELYMQFCEIYQNDLQITQLRRELQDPSLNVPIGGANSNNAFVRVNVDEGLFEDLRSTHLVIAIFWQERSKQKIRIRPKLCHRDSESHDILQESLVKDDCSILLKDFPELFQKLVTFTIRKVARLFPDPIYPWKLTIELFVPVDLLCQPLSTWCGQSGELPKTRSIVIGCSDRFDPDRPVEAADLHNQLKHGWQRFQSHVPDRYGSTLRNLSWLSSDEASQESLESFSGFRCYGGWLTPEEQSLDNWQKLVRSGIPVALWMCEGSPPRQDITSVFDRLIEGTRFEFLDRIPIIRNGLQITSNHCVGVFYEDPNYVPDIPLPEEEQFFSWPGA